MNLDGVALAVESLRSVLSSNLNVPHPASADTVETTRFTRRSGQTVIEPSQLIPVILSLIEEVVKTRFIRQDFDDGYVFWKGCAVALLNWVQNAGICARQQEQDNCTEGGDGALGDHSQRFA